MKNIFMLLGIGALTCFLSACNEEVSSAVSDELISGPDEKISSSSSSIDEPASSSSSSSFSSSSSAKKSDALTAYSYGKLVDERDSTVYRTVKIGALTWMAENLKYKTEKSYCYDDSPENCEKYGRLYNWSAAMDSVGKFTKSSRGCGYSSNCPATWPVRGICPEGWHLPDYEESKVLLASAGGSRLAGRMLKSADGWYNDGDGEDEYGFSVVPAGMRTSDGGYQWAEARSYLWTSAGNSATSNTIGFSFDSLNASIAHLYVNFALSVRCVKNEPYMTNEEQLSSSSVKFGDFVDSRDSVKYKTVTIGEQVWMAENLKYECEKSYCYNDNFGNCETYGRFYDWSLAQDVCPKGWHLPDTVEWNSLFTYMGGMHRAGLLLRAKSGWKQGITAGLDAYGFSALPSGRRDSAGVFTEGYWNYPEYGYFWSSTDKGDNLGYYVFVSSDLEAAGMSSYYKNDYRSVRCVRDEPASSSSSSAKSSSSSAERSSSSVKSSSSGKTVYSSFLWDGTTDLIGRVETGSPEETAGYWFNYSDDYEGGSSRFTFPPDVEPDSYDNFFGPLVEAYAGIKASVTLGDGYDYPYVGLGFNVWSENQEGVDVSKWGGICLSYQSTIPFVIELGVEDEATLTEYVNYRASVSVSNTITAVDFSWAKFRRDWGPGPSIEDVLKKVAAIKLKFEGEAGTTGDILIQKLGSLGECNYYVLL